MAWMIPIMAADARRSPGEEDQVLASLIGQDTAQRYEFKILRGNPGAFRGEERLQRVLEEEAHAQWELAMKLDDMRIALRRPRDARSRDALRNGGVDPYRTELASNRSALLLVVLAVGVLAALFIGLLVASPARIGVAESMISVAIGVALVLFVLLASIARGRRR